MRKLMFFFVLITTLFADDDNNFYNNEQTFPLSGTKIIEIVGEVKAPLKIDLAKLPTREVLVREAIPITGDSVAFIGAYRYDGISLFDILSTAQIEKKNETEFGSVIDLMIKVIDAQGNYVLFSWGEIFYPAERHATIIATSVAPIIPSKTKQQWQIPTKTALICGDDLLALRRIENPVRIEIFSSPRSFTVKRDTTGTAFIWSKSMLLFDSKAVMKEISDLPNNSKFREYPSVFFGRGRGFHRITTFVGVPFADFLREQYKLSRADFAKTFFVVAAADGYRISISACELFNRNDFCDFLLIPKPENESGGKFALFPSPDYFSDRAVKSVAEIHLIR